MEETEVWAEAVKKSDEVFRQNLQKSGLDYRRIVLHTDPSYASVSTPARLQSIPDLGEGHYAYTAGRAGAYVFDQRVFRVYFRIGTNFEGGRLVYIEDGKIMRLDTLDQITDWRPGPRSGLLFVRNDSEEK